MRIRTKACAARGESAGDSSPQVRVATLMHSASNASRMQEMAMTAAKGQQDLTLHPRDPVQPVIRASLAWEGRREDDREGTGEAARLGGAEEDGGAGLQRPFASEKHPRQ